MSVQYHAVNQKTFILHSISFVFNKIERSLHVLFLLIDNFFVNRFHRDGESAMTQFSYHSAKLLAIWFVETIRTVETASCLLSKMILIGLNLLSVKSLIATPRRIHHNGSLWSQKSQVWLWSSRTIRYYILWSCNFCLTLLKWCSINCFWNSCVETQQCFSSF